MAQYLRRRLGQIVVGRTQGRTEDGGNALVFAADIGAAGAMAALLRDAMQPNFVQTRENHLALVHGTSREVCCPWLATDLGW